ncbi:MULTISPECIES: formate/nitrite transporter family protein [Haloarcula]|uniref:Formate dehydrogenase n=1 Tax=Haloarcula pellucida TaxID=1427151 RepID=A0A830GHU9_9EURY|nr:MULTISPECIES: formate/nitrite transporter family protein [Halomicroarcula]MBX0346823.1 formate/nitrite transporter family protein [Halomicroarcula pellucida]MDS0277303.1 formate/nitrite transporter family protein [Halomicroarcula sp. S1AR25-4]GGN85655.1 formate dehydrogenase [Halomicroarcula pellucida]
MSDDTDRETAVRDAVDVSQSGAPAGGHTIRDRFSADEIFQRIVVAADEEITATTRELFFSGLAAGFAITVTFLLYASLYASTDGDPVLSALLYPLGFVFIILGDYQLYTENTLPPVALTLERLASLPSLMRIWGLVLLANLAGGLLGALALSSTGVLSPAAASAAEGFAQKAIETPWWTLFSKAVFAGLIVAGVVWVDYSLRDSISRLALVYVSFLAIPFGNLYHVVVSATEMLYLVFNGELALWVGVSQFVVPVLLGNSIGGVVLVTVVNYFQTTERRLASAREAGKKSRLTVREWVLGGFSDSGRSYVPVNGHDRD